MTPFSGLPFFLALGVVLTPALILGLCGKPLRGYNLIATAALLLLVFDTWKAKLALAAFWALETLLCLGYARFRTRLRSPWLFRAALGLCLAPLILVKLSGPVSRLRFFSLLGVSYMTFRAAGVLLDLRDGRLDAVNPLDFSCYLLFAPAVSSGPLDRYRRFEADLRAKPDPEAYALLVRDGVWKLTTGALYNFCFGNLIWTLWLAKLPERGFLPTLSYFYGYTFFMFFNFAGYSRMAVGASYLLGVRTPDNFNRPFLAADMKDFWARWHISLSTWLRDYVYTRFCMAALRNKRFKGKRTASYVGYFITMALMGVWHGLAPHFLVYGCYHGLLMSANELLDTKWKRFKKLKKQPVARAVMGLITFHLFAFGLLIFSGRLFQ